MSDLIITKSVLDYSVTALHSIGSELRNQQSSASAIADVYGQDDLKWAMHDFAGDWEIHRNQIADTLQDLSDKMQKSLEYWTSLESELHDKLTTEKHDA